MKIGDNVKTSFEFNTHPMTTRKPINNGIITDLKMVDYHVIAMVKEGRKKPREININFLERIEQ